jgi:pimeloyl-ACP methyl ester carboxylesterase
VLRAFAEGALMGEVFGSGDPVVLALHGWSRSRRDFFGVLSPAGSSQLDAIALDLPGSGASPPPPGPWGSPEYADHVASVLDVMRVPVVVLGHSFGGRIALHLAASRPDAIAGMVLTGVPFRRPTASPPRSPVAFRAGRLLHRAGFVSERRMEALRRRYGSSDYRAAEGVMRQVLVKVVNETYDEIIPTISCPVTLVWGEDDDIAPVSVARSVVDEFPRATLLEVPRAGHLTPLSVPSALRDAVSALLASGAG